MCLRNVFAFIFGLILLTGFYPFLVFARFVRPVQATRRGWMMALFGATLFTATAGVSFLVFVTAAMLWVRSGYFKNSDRTLSTSFRPTVDETGDMDDVVFRFT